MNASDLNSNWRFSSAREKLVEYLFLGDLLRVLWLQDMHEVDVLRPDVDNGGFDLVLGYADLLRHIQIKSSLKTSSAGFVNVSLSLAERPSGCVVWVRVDPETLQLGPFWWFGGLPGELLPSIDDYPSGKHTTGDSKGVKKERPGIRRVPRRAFEVVDSIEEVAGCIFGHL